MIIWFLLLFPLATCAVLFWFFRDAVRWIAYPIVAVGSVVIIAVTSWISESSQTRAHEYWGGYVTSARYTEPWNEWIEETCKQCVATDSAGNCTSYTEYDCSYCSEHGPSWDIETTVGSYSGENLYNRAAPTIGPVRFVPLGRSSQCPFARNGNAYESVFTGDSARLFPIFSGRAYENRVQAAPTLFSYREIDPAKTPVFSYPDDADGPDHETVLSRVSFPHQQEAVRRLQWYNGRYGGDREVHAYLLVFRGGSVDLGLAQEAFWRGGGKNELVTTVGVDASDSILWCHVFSWSPKKDVGIAIRDSFLAMGKLDGVTAAEAIGKLGVRKFTRKHFRDFAYVRVQPSTTAVALAALLVILLCVAIPIAVARYDAHVEQRDRYRRHWRY